VVGHDRLSFYFRGPRSVALYVVAQALYAAAFSAWPAAKQVAIALQAMSDDPHATRSAPGSQRMDGAFETVECVRFTA
jgi:hypothetical protein